MRALVVYPNSQRRGARTSSKAIQFERMECQHNRLIFLLEVRQLILRSRLRSICKADPKFPRVSHSRYDGAAKTIGTNHRCGCRFSFTFIRVPPRVGQSLCRTELIVREFDFHDATETDPPRAGVSTHLIATNAELMSAEYEVQRLTRCSVGSEHEMWKRLVA